MSVFFSSFLYFPTAQIQVMAIFIPSPPPVMQRNSYYDQYRLQCKCAPSAPSVYKLPAVPNCLALADQSLLYAIFLWSDGFKIYWFYFSSRSVHGVLWDPLAVQKVPAFYDTWLQIEGIVFEKMIINLKAIYKLLHVSIDTTYQCTKTKIYKNEKYYLTGYYVLQSVRYYKRTI